METTMKEPHNTDERQAGAGRAAIACSADPKPTPRESAKRRKKFQIGDRVHMTPYAVKVGLCKGKPNETKGVITGFPAKGVNYKNLVYVQTESRKTPEAWGISFWELD